MAGDGSTVTGPDHQVPACGPRASLPEVRRERDAGRRDEGRGPRLVTCSSGTARYCCAWRGTHAWHCGKDSAPRSAQALFRRGRLRGRPRPRPAGRPAAAADCSKEAITDDLRMRGRRSGARLRRLDRAAARAFAAWGHRIAGLDADPEAVRGRRDRQDYRSSAPPACRPNPDTGEVSQTQLADQSSAW